MSHGEACAMGAPAPGLAGRLLRLCLLSCLLLLSGTALAATYTYRSDSFAWESAANTVSWDKTCTSYPGDDDKATINFTGGFTFTFAATKYSSVRVISNGALQFGNDSGFYRSYTNTNLPVAAAASGGTGCGGAATTNVMLAYWTDLNPSQAGSGKVSWEQKGTAPNRYVVVSWNGVYQYNTSTPYSVQIVLYENGEFKYQYGNANATGSQATIGVQVDASDYTLYSFNSGYNANGSAIRWSLPSTSITRVADYHFDELSWSGAVGEVTDSSGNGHGGVRVGAASSVTPGVVCRALDVPANTSSVSAGVDTTLDIANAVGATGSISLWYRSTLAWTSASDGELFDATVSANRSFHLVRRSNGSLRFALTDSGNSNFTVDTANQAFAANTWVHITAIWRLRTGNNQSVLRLYLNGVLAGTTLGTSTGALHPSLGALFVGDSRANITSNSATINSANGRFDELRVSNYELSPAEIVLDMAQTHGCAPPLHHLELRHASGTGLTCIADSVTVEACQDAACSTPYTGGVSGLLTSSQVVTLWPATAAFVIAPGGSSTSVALQLPVAGPALLGLTGALPVPTQPTTCNFGSPACTYTADDAGFIASVVNHVAESSQTLTISAVRKADASTACVPAFASVSRALRLGCSYANPSSGTLPVRVGGKALNAAASATSACDGGAIGQTVTLAFNTGGVASTTLQYADAGVVALGLTYLGSNLTGDLGLTLAGSASFITAPASLAFSAITPGPIRAGSAFSATLSAVNSAGAVMPNFGRETGTPAITLGHSRAQPSGSGASNGVFIGGTLGSFSGGKATAANLVWSEVGRIDLTASLSNYLGSGLGASGSTGTAGAVGRFIPHHFDVTATPACGAFSYAGQPFAVQVVARNGLASPGTTLNYDGSSATSPNFAQIGTLVDRALGGLGSFNGSGALPASAFRAGVATLTTPAYSFASKLSAPATAVLRATDADSISSAGYAEPAMPLRSGRLRVFNTFGSEKTALGLPVQAQYWSGSAWLLNTIDSCTALPPAAVVAVQYLDHRGVATTAWPSGVGAVSVVNGQTRIDLAAPPGGRTGSIDFSLNLGSAAADQSCLASHPASTGAALPWLRAQNGACATGWASDPSARASFGIASPETRKSVHVREMY
jgi:MSHA biogenesis protein MshQ